MSNQSFSQRMKDEEYIQLSKHYIDKNSDYYIRKWQKHKNPLHYSGWNWTAFFIAPIWLASRHLYLWTAFYFSLYLFVATLHSLSPLFNHYTSLPVDSLLFWYISAAVINSFFFGVMGNALYARYINKFLTEKNSPVIKKRAPLFSKSGRSIISALITPILLYALLLLPLQWIFLWEVTPTLPYGVYIYEENESPVNQDPPIFHKYSDEDILLLYYGEEPVSDKEFKVILHFFDIEIGEWDVLRERTYSFFTSDKVTLDLINASNPLTGVGEYKVEVYLNGELVGEQTFRVSM